MFELRSERLVLRDFREDDFETLHAYSMIPKVVEFESWGPNSEDDTRAFLERTIAAQSVEPRRVFELAVTLDGRHIGGAGLRTRERNHEGDLGYILHPDHWGQGFATEAARALLRHGFETLGLHRIWATCHVDHVRSARVLERIGMKREGHMRGHQLIRDVWTESYLYAIIVDDLSGPG